MNKDKVFSILRIVFSIVGAWLLGKNIGGTVIDPNTLQIIIGIVLGLAGMIWSFFDQTSKIESFQATIMQVFLFGGGILVSSGKISADKLQSWIPIVTMLGALLYPLLSRKKSQDVAEGKIPIEALKGVNEDGAPQKEITPVLNMQPPK